MPSSSSSLLRSSRATAATALASILLLSTLLVLLLSSSPSPLRATAQLANKLYDTQPTFAYTFDVNPLNNYATGVQQSSGSTFEYTVGAGSHVGVLSFDGSHDTLNLSRFYDDNGRILATTLLGGEMSFEVWASWYALNSWSRIFDFGGPAGSNDNNIYLANQGTSGNIIFNTYVGSSSYGIVSNSISLYNWQHIVATVEVNPAANASIPSTGAILSLYLNGVRVQRAVGYLPTVMVRPNSFIGKSNWADGLFRGLYDDIFVYNYSLSAEAISAHYVVPRIAVYELTFSADPRINMNLVGNSQATYAWVTNDTADSTTAQAAHSGLLSLTASSSQYLDVSLEAGFSQVGADLPVLGGSGWVNADNFSIGWSFEVTFKLTTIASGACVFDFGNPSSTSGSPADDRIALCVSSGALTFETSNSLAATRVTRTIVSSLAANTWYHVVVLVQPQADATASTVARVEAFVNGVYADSTSTGAWVRSVTRTKAYIGRSSVSTAPYLNGLVDSIRVYDYALSPAEIRALYGVTSATTRTVTPLFTTGPSVSHTFDVSVPWSERNGGTALDWLTTYVGRAGILSQTQASSQYINLLTLPDRNFKLFPGYFGGRSFSFEFWIYWTTFSAYQRVLEIGGEPSASGSTTYLDDLVITTQVQTNLSQAANISFSLNSGNAGITNAVANAYFAVYVNRWYHLVCTVDVDRTMPLNATGSATLNLFLNGALAASTPSIAPRYASRAYAWLSKGRNSWNTYLGGYLDAFHYYDYEVELEAVRVHALVPRPPLFEMVWAERPNELPGVDWTVGYGWTNVDTVYSTTAGQSNHQGLLQLTAASTNYLDLVAVNATNSMGTVMPQLGELYSSGVRVPGTVYEFAEWAGQPATRSGMTIEATFLYTSATGANGKLFSCGATTTGIDLIELGFSAGSRALLFSVQNSDVARTDSVTVIANTYYQLWYHVAIVLRSTSQPSSLGTWEVYVNGVLVSTNTNRVFPYETLRDYCSVGRSVSGSADSYFDGYIDSFRVFDYALNGTEVQNIFAVVSPTVDPATGVVPTIAVSSSVAPAAAAVSSSAAAAGGGGGATATASSSVAAATVSSSVAAVTVSSSAASPIVVASSSSSGGEGTPSAASSSSSDLSSGAIAGIVIGGVAAVIILIAVLVLLRGRSGKASGGQRPSTQQSASGASHGDVEMTGHEDV